MQSKTNVSCKWLEVLASALIGVAPTAASAGGHTTAIDSGSIQRDFQASQKGDVEAPYERLSLPSPQKKNSSETLFSVSSFVLTGVTVLTPDESVLVLKPWTDKQLDFSALSDAALALEGYYQSKGFLARVVIPPQDVIDGVVKLTVIEGRLGKIEIVKVDKWPVTKERLISTLHTLVRSDQTLDLVALERAIGLINTLSGVRASGAIKPGIIPETSDAVITIDRTSVFGGVVQTDNTGNARTGASRLSTNLAWNNPGGYGDRLQSNLMISQGLRYLQMGYSSPAGYASDRLELSASRLNYTLIGGVPGLLSLGSASVASLEWTRQLAYARQWRTDMSAQFTRSLFSDTSGPETTERQVQAAVISLSSTRYWGTAISTSAQLSLTSGRVDLSQTPVNQGLDQAGLKTEGAYRKVNLSLTQIAQIRPESSLHIKVSGQWAQKNLDSSQRFALGGANGVRAYPSSEGSGDQGVLISAEWHEVFSPEVQVKAFYDIGRTRKFKSPVPGVLDTPNRYSLRGRGVGLDYRIRPMMTLSMVLARRMGDNPGAQLSESGSFVENDGTRRLNRILLSLTANF